MHSLRVNADTRPERKIRRGLLFQWVIAITFISWMLAYTTHFTLKSIVVASIVTLTSIPVGWLFGYKLGFCGLFTGFYQFSNEESVKT